MRAHLCIQAPCASPRAPGSFYCAAHGGHAHRGTSGPTKSRPTRRRAAAPVASSPSRSPLERLMRFLEWQGDVADVNRLHLVLAAKHGVVARASEKPWAAF